MKLKTKKVEFTEILHNITNSDSYRWLETESDERTAWIKEQNDFTREHLDRVEGREQIRTRLEELLLVDTVSAPSVREGKIFYYKHRHDQQHSVLHMKEWEKDSVEKILIDPNEMSDDGSVAIFGVSIPKDGTIMAYGLTTHGSDWAQWKVVDIDSGKILDEIPRLAYTHPVWLPDNSGFYYSRSDHTQAEELTKTHRRIFFHKLGTDWRQDEYIFGQGLKETEGPYIAEISEDGKHAILGISKGWSDEELFYMNLESPKRTIHSITKGVNGLFTTKIKNDILYLLTNNDASNFRICTVDLDGTVPSFEKWKTIIPEEEDRVIRSMSIFNDKILVNEKRNIVTCLKEYSLDGTFTHEIDLPALGTASVPYGKEEMGAVFLTFESFFHPSTTYQYDLDTRTLTEYTKNEYPFDPNMFTTEQVWFNSKDGTEVPMFVVKKKDIELTGKNKTILYGYGGFNNGLYPSFSAARVYWLEQGNISVIANLRGGDEFGEDWHKAGQLEHRQNVFDDFIAAAEALTGAIPSRVGDEGYSKKLYTSTPYLGIQGGSNGGLLVGAVTEQRPDLFGGVICSVPLLDMLRFHLTEGGAYWKLEYGDPDDPEHFPFILAYSPYQHVTQPEKYPAMFFQTALGDDRGVDPMHAMKMTASMQEYNISDNPIFLTVKTGTGHGHSKPIKMIINELVDNYSFMQKYLGTKAL